MERGEGRWGDGRCEVQTVRRIDDLCRRRELKRKRMCWKKGRSWRYRDRKKEVLKESEELEV